MKEILSNKDEIELPKIDYQSQNQSDNSLKNESKKKRLNALSLEVSEIVKKSEQNTNNSPIHTSQNSNRENNLFVEDVQQPKKLKYPPRDLKHSEIGFTIGIKI